MQKKILASLLVTPVAFSAMADITIAPDLVNNGEGWTQTGVTGDTNVFQNGEIKCPINTGVLSYTESGLCTGTYSIKFAAEDNIQVSVNGKVIAAKDGAYSFEIKADDGTGSADIKIQSLDKVNGFSLSNAQLILVFDFEAASDALMAKLPAEDAITEITSKNPTAATLQTKADELEDERTRLASAIEGLKTVDNQKADYKTYKLWDYPASDVLTADIAALDAAIKALNTQIQAENTAYSNEQTNIANRDAATAAINAVQTALNEVEASIKASNITYVTESTAAAVTAAQDAIDAEKARIEAAYGNSVDLAASVIAFTSNAQKAQDLVDALKTQAAEATADWNAYTKIVDLRNQLLEAKTSADEQLAALSTANANFAGYIAAQEQAVDTLYDDAITAVPAVVEGAAKVDITPLTANKTAIGNTVDNTKTYITNQNALHTAAVTEVAAKQTALNGINITNLPNDEAKAKAQELKTAAQNAINALNDKIAADYAAAGQSAENALTEDQYQTELSNIQTLIDNLNTYLGPWAPVTALESKYDKMLKDVAGFQTSSGIKTTEFDLASKFNGTDGNFQSIRAAIDALYDKVAEGTEVTKADLNSVETAITATTDEAKTLMTAYADASKLVGSFTTYVANLTNYCKQKVDLTGKFNFEVYKGMTEAVNMQSSDLVDGKFVTYKSFIDSYNNFAENLKTVAGEAAQECYEDALALSKEITAYNPTKAYNVQFTQFEREGSLYNFVFVDALLAEVSAADNGTYYGQSGIGTRINNVSNALTTINNSLSRATKPNKVSATTAYGLTNLKTYTTADNNLKTQKGLLDTILTDIATLKQNQADYDELMGNYNPIVNDQTVEAPDGTTTTVLSLLNDLAEFNEKNSLAPAKAYFEGVIAGLETEAENLGKTLKAALEMGLNKANNATGKKATLQTSIDALKTKIETTKTTITDNNAKYEAQIKESGSVAATIKGYIETMEQADEKAAANDTSDWRDELTKLLNDSLPPVDKMSYDAYGKGEAATQNQAIMDAYAEILKQADAVYAEFDNEFAGRIKAGNDQVVKDCNWSGTQADMLKAYNDAIGTYNEFFTLDNATYRNFILKVVQSNSVLFKYYAQIVELEGNVEAWINEQNDPENPHKLTADEFNNKVNPLVIALTGNISDSVNKLLTEVYNAALAYFMGGEYSYVVTEGDNEGQTITGTVDPGLDKAKRDYITAAENEMTAAGVVNPVLENALKNAKDALAVAGTAFEAAVKDEATFGMKMNGIANTLDGISVNVDAAAKAQWSADWTAATGEFTAMLADIDNYSSTARAEIEGYQADAEAINAEAEADAKLIDNLKTYQESLKAAVDAAQAVYDAAKNAWESDKANEKLYNDNVASFEGLTSKLEALEQYAASLAGGNIDSTIAAIEAQIEAVTKLNEDNKANVNSVQTDITAKVADIETAITNGYSASKSAEIAALNSLLNRAKEAFNNASKYGNAETKGKLDGWNEEINGYATKIAALTNPETLNNNAAFKTAATAVEKPLADLYATINQSYSDSATGLGGDPLTPILNALTAQYDEVAGQLAAAEAALDRCLESVKADFPNAYKAMSEALAGVKSVLDAKSNTLILSHATYAADMEEIASEIETKAAEIEAANEVAMAEKAKKDANDAAYTDLNKQLANLTAEAQAAKQLAENYGVADNDGLTGRYATIEALIEAAQQAIDLDNSNVDLTAESVLPNADEISTAIDSYTVQAENLNTQNKYAAAEAAVATARGALTQNVVPAIAKELNEQLAALAANNVSLNSERQQLVVNYNGAEMTLDEFRTAIDELNSKFADNVAAAEAIAARADENVFVLGNVDLDKNGEVNIGDLQTLIAWIGAGVTYEELYEENPVVAAAADCAGNEKIDIADATALVQIIMNENAMAAGETDAPVARVFARKHVVAADANVAMPMTANEDGVRTYEVMLSNNGAFIGAQVDLHLPSGMTLDEAKLSSRANGHDIYVFDNGNGNYRLVVLSMQNDAFSGVDGSLIQLSISGIGNPELVSMLLVDPDMNTCAAKAADVTMLDSLMMNATNVKDAIYNVAGQTMRAIQRGINIIRHSDGSTTKELH